MKLNEPKCCGECFFKNEELGSPFCTYQMQTMQSETNARLDVTIDLTSVPNWCPIRKTNKMIEELPIEKQRALDSISNGLQILFGVERRWVKMTGMMPPEYHGHYECLECQWHMRGLRNSWTREEELSYYSNCGAKMDLENKDENY